MEKNHVTLIIIIKSASNCKGKYFLKVSHTQNGVFHTIFTTWICNDAIIIVTVRIMGKDGKVL